MTSTTGIAAQAFPLCWPEGWPRTPLARRTHSPYKVTPDRAIGLAVDGLRAIERAGASQILHRAYSAFGAP